MTDDTPPPSTAASEFTQEQLVALQARLTAWPAMELDEVSFHDATEFMRYTGRAIGFLLSRLSAGEGVGSQQSVAESASATREDAGTASIIIGADFKAPDSAADLLSDISLTLTAIDESRLAPTRSQACDLFQRARDELARLRQPVGDPDKSDDLGREWDYAIKLADQLRAPSIAVQPYPEAADELSRLALQVYLYRHRIKNAERELAAVNDKLAEAERAWRTMDDAPLDGTEVLLRVEWRAGIQGCALVGHWMPGGHCIEDHPPINAGWYFWNGRVFDEAAKPTHWMPLPPSPPTRAGAGEP